MILENKCKNKVVEKVSHFFQLWEQGASHYNMDLIDASVHSEVYFQMIKIGKTTSETLFRRRQLYKKSKLTVSKFHSKIRTLVVFTCFEFLKAKSLNNDNA